MEMPKVTKEHEKLHVFAGEWEGEEMMSPGPMGRGGKGRYVYRCVEVKTVGAVVEFTRNSKGEVVGATLRQGGQILSEAKLRPRGGTTTQKDRR